MGQAAAIADDLVSASAPTSNSAVERMSSCVT